MFDIDFNKICEDISKGAAEAGKVIGDAAKTAGKSVSEGAEVAGKAISEGANNAGHFIDETIHNIKMDKYNPVFLDDFNSENFDMPKLVVIVDEDCRKGIDVCEGAIGWLSKNCVPEVFFIYEEFVQKSGLTFYPLSLCGGSYYRHPFESDMYLKVEDYIEICRENQLTELKNIAYKLGASKCSVEVYQDSKLFESVKATSNINGSTNINNNKASFKNDTTYSQSIKNEQSFHIAMCESFASGNKAEMPEVQWFSNDKEIMSLIKKRCSSNLNRELKECSFDITSSASISISIDLAENIEGSLKKSNVKVRSSFKKNIEKEESKHFLYRIIF